MRKASSFLCLRDEVCEDIAGRRSERGAASRAGKQSQPDRFLGRRSLGSPTLVTMMETTDLRDRKNRTRIGRLHSARFRGILLQCQMSSCLVIVIGISPQMTPQAAFVEHDHLIQHSRRMLPITRSICARCQGERGADNTCSIPIAFTCSTNSWPKMRSRSRSK